MENTKFFTIQLNGLRFFGSHGWYPSETLLNTELVIDLSFQLKIPENGFKTMQDTVDYSRIYKTIQAEMHKDYQLLEDLALNLTLQIRNMDKRIQSCRVKVTKSPQLGGPTGDISVVIEN